ncbi:Usp domain-containing protein [Rubrivivax sp. A210]|uniref:universal stress protein n=1 Tax=Rubrivivax sp. A210 TaxID=2772301 RepID=UPI001919C12D|nr:universal stress protein [Rubrivivax sp. A210]CAD5372438.1 Usp domain-containing protein [Rubrivivax sp. A210]
MFKHILVPVDGSDLAERAVETSLELAKRLGARITAFVAEPMPPLPAMGATPASYAREADTHLARTEAHAWTVLGRFGNRAAEVGVGFEGKFVRSEAVDQAIVDAAEELGCDLIVMVTHGRGTFGELLFGSHTKNVLARSKLPLLVLR